MAEFPNIGYLAQPAVRDRRALRLAAQGQVAERAAAERAAAEKAAATGDPLVAMALGPEFSKLKSTELTHSSITEASDALLGATETCRKDRALVALAAISTIVIGEAHNHTASRGAAEAHTGGFHMPSGRGTVAGGLLKELHTAQVIPRIANSLRIYISERDVVLRGCWALEELFNKVVQCRSVFVTQCDGAGLIRELQQQYSHDGPVLEVCAALQYTLATLRCPRVFGMCLVLGTGAGCPAPYLMALQCSCMKATTAVAPEQGGTDASIGAAKMSGAVANISSASSEELAAGSSTVSRLPSSEPASSSNIPRRSSLGWGGRAAGVGESGPGRPGGADKGWGGNSSRRGSGAPAPLRPYAGKRRSTVHVEQRIIVYDIAANSHAPALEVTVKV